MYHFQGVFEVIKVYTCTHNFGVAHSYYMPIYNFTLPAITRYLTFCPLLKIARHFNDDLAQSLLHMKLFFKKIAFAEIHNYEMYLAII